MPSETLTSCWTSNDDGGPTSDNTVNKALRIMGCDTGPGGDHRAHGFRSTASTLLNEEGAFDGHVVEAQLVTRRRKKRRRRDEVVRRQLGKGHKNKVPGIYNRAAYRAERVRLMQHWSDRPRLGQLGFEAALFGRAMPAQRRSGCHFAISAATKASVASGVEFFATASEIDVAACRCLAISRAGNFLRPTVGLLRLPEFLRPALLYPIRWSTHSAS
jgi:hypothetical protein